MIQIPASQEDMDLLSILIAMMQKVI